MRAAAVIGLLAAGALAVAGCFGNETTAFPPGLEPLEDNTAPPPAAQPGDPYPETLTVVSGSTDGYSWTHARGYVHAPLAEVWAALRDPAVVADPSVRSYTVETLDDPDVDLSFVLHYTDDRVIEVHFDVTWRFGRLAGSEAAPERVAARFKKTWGTEFIYLMEGSVIARAVDDSTTEVELIEHLDAMTSGTAETEAYLKAVYGNLI